MKIAGANSFPVIIMNHGSSLFLGNSTRNEDRQRIKKMHYYEVIFLSGGKRFEALVLANEYPTTNNN